MTLLCQKRVLLFLCLTTLLPCLSGLAQENIPEKVAILPFTWGDEVDESVKEKHPNGPQLAREVFYQAFSSTGYDEVPMETIDQLVSEEAIEAGDFSTLVDNGIDGLLQAEIHGLTIGKGGIVSRTSAEIDFTLLNLKTDQVVWSDKESVSRMGGLLMSSGQLTRAFGSLNVTEDESTREIRYVLMDLYTKVLQNLPPANISLVPPVIENHKIVAVAADMPSRPAGVQVWLEGSAGCSAFFDLSEAQDYIPLLEYAPGKYFGFFATESQPETITLHIENGLGIQTMKEVRP